MTDGNVVVLDCSSDVSVLVERKFKEIGGIWSICGINNDSELAAGALSGLHVIQIGQKDLKPTQEHYLKELNVWNIREYDTNKLIATCWKTSHCYLIDRNDTKSLVKPVIITNKNKENNHITDLYPLPGYHAVKCPFFVKRGMQTVSLVDVKNMVEYVMYEEENAKLGYNKMSVIDRGQGRFDLLFVVSEGGAKNIIKRFSYPSIFQDGLRKIINLRHKLEEPPTLLQKLFKRKN